MAIVSVTGSGPIMKQDGIAWLSCICVLVFLMVVGGTSWGTASPGGSYPTRSLQQAYHGSVELPQSLKGHATGGGPYVNDTLVLSNSTLMPGNFLAVNVLRPFGTAYDSGKGEVFVAGFDSSTVGVISDATNTVITTVATGDNPWGVAYDRGKGEVFVTDCGSSNVEVINDTTNRVVATVPVGSSPEGVAYDSGKGEVFVANSGSKNVSVINDTRNKVVASTNVGTTPQGVAYDSGKAEIFVMNSITNNISIVSDATNAVATNLAVGGPGSGPFMAAYDKAKGEMFVTDAGSTYVNVINDTTDSSSNIDVGSGLAAIAYDGGKGEVFVTIGSSVSVISDVSYTVTATIAVGTYPESLSYDNAKAEVFVANSGSNSVSVISDSTNTLTATVTTGTLPTGVAYDRGKGEVFVADVGTATVEPDSVRVINDTTGKVVATVTVGNSPQDMAYDSKKGEVFVANRNSNSVSVIDDATDAVAATVTVAGSPYGITYDRAKSEVFVSESGSSNVTVINDTTNSIVTKVAVGISPIGLAYDPAKGVVFVANSGSDSVSVINDTTNSLFTTVGVGASPYGVTYDSVKGEMFITNSGSNGFSVINDTTNAVVATVAVENAPQGVAYDRVRGEVFIADSASSAVTVINDTTYETVATLTVGNSPNGMAYDAGNGIVYASNYNQGTVSMISPGPVLTSVSVAPPSPTVAAGGIQSFTATIACSSTCPPGTTYSWSLNNTLGNLNHTSGSSVTFTAGHEGGSVTLTVTASLDGIDRQANSIITVTSPPPSTLSSVAVSPSPENLEVMGSAIFVAHPTCSATCPPSITYAWNLTRSDLGALNTSTGTSVQFTAGNTLGALTLFVNATLNGTMKQSSPVDITITSPPPSTLSSVTVAPTSANIPIGVTRDFTATPACTGGSCPTGTSFSWTLTNTLGTLNSSAGDPVGFTAGNLAGVVTLFVNGTLDGKKVQSSPTNITIVPVLSSVSLSPNSATRLVGGDANFTATPACTGGSCPAGTVFSWTITNGAMGSLSSTTGDQVMFTAESTAGTLGLFVNATLNGVTKSASATITILSSSAPTLSSVAVNPRSVSVAANGTQTFTASSVCSSGACPAGTTYSWSLTSGLGSLNTSSGSSVTFTAGSRAGTVALFLNATLDGKTVGSSAIVTITTSTSSSGQATSWWLWLVIALVAAVVILVVLLLRERGNGRVLRSQGQGAPPPPALPTPANLPSAPPPAQQPPPPPPPGT